MAIKTFSTLAAYDAAKATLTAADTVTIKDNTLTAADVAVLGADPLVDAIRVSPLSLKIDQFTAAQAKLNALDKITVSDTAALINTNLATLLANAKVDSIAATGGPIQLTVAQAGISTNLAKIPAGSVVSVVDTSANIQSKLGALFSNAKITYINSNEDGVALTLTPAQATNPANIFKLQTADKIVVSGANTDIQPNLSALLAIAKVDSIISNGGVIALNATQATTANLNKLNGTSNVSVIDTSAAIQSKLVALLASAKVDFINSTENAVALKLTAAQAVTAIDAGSLVKIQATDRLVVADSSANIQANLTKLLANAKIDAIDSNQNLVAINLTAAQVTTANMLKLQAADNLAVVDTGANIQSKLAALLAEAKVDTITTSDASALTLKAAAAVADSAAKISGTIAVSDTSAAINANLDALLADAKVTSINSTQDTTAITLTAAQALVAANLDKLQTADNIVVALSASDNLTADQITALNALVGGKVDSIQNGFSFTATTDSLVAEGNGISFTVTSLIPVAVDTTFTYSIQGNGTNPTIASDLTPTSGTVKILAGQSTANFTVNAINEGVAEFDEGAIVTLKNGTAVVGTQAFTVTDGASYTLVADAASANEGSSATFTLNTVNVADNTVLTYTLSGTNIDASDIVGGSLTGTTTVMGGVATIDVQLASDLKTEGAETLKVTVEGKTANAVVNDTSLDATYTLVADQATANEGANATFTLTSNAPVGSVVDYTLSGVSAEDVTGGLLTGQATIGASGTATITVPLVADQLTEGSETLTVTAGGQTATTAVNDSSVAAVLAADAVSGTIVNGQGTAIMNATTIASWLANDKDTTGLAAPTGAVTIDMNSAVGGQLLVLGSGDTMFVANAGVRLGSFEYSVAGITTTKGTVNVTLNTVPVVGSGTTLAATEDTVANGTITVTDGDNDALTYTFANGAHGTVVAGANGAYTYTPAANYNGADTITATISDGYTTVTQDIAVTVAAVNDDPQAITPAPAAIAAKSGQTGITVDLSQYATDPDLAAGVTTGLTFTVPATTTKGGVVTLGADGHTATITYPQGGGSAALGTDTLAFTVKDAVSAAIPATVTLNVTNTAPVAGAIALTAKTGVTQTIDLLAGTSTQGSTVTNFTSGVSDADGNTLTPAVVVGSLSNGGSAEVLNGKIVYTSTVGFVGTETLKYTISDGFGGTSAEQTITFTVASNTGGTSGNDLLFGSTAAENIDGLAGDDTIVGGGGLDTITGGDGNDTVTFSDGAVQVQGGNGIDTLVVNASAVATIFDLSATSTTAATVTGKTLTANNQLADNNSKNNLNNSVVVLGFENLDASKASSVIVQDASTTTSIITGSGADTVYLNKTTGTATVTVGDGNDTVTIGAAATGKFSVDGGAGNDVITAGSAVDTLIGGAGDDTFKFADANIASSDQITGGDGADIIEITDTATIVDADLTGALTAETLKLSFANSSTSGSATFAQTVVLGAQAQEAGIVTVDASLTASEITVDASAAGYTSGVTVLAGLATSGDLSVTGGSGNDTIVSNATHQLDTTATGDDYFVGGAGTDKIRLDNDSAVDGTGNAVTMTVGAGLVSGVEQILINDIATDNVAGDVTVSFVAGYAQTSGLTIDGSALDAGEVLTVDTSANAASETVTITGGAADDVFTLSSIADSVNGGAGNDTFNFADANITNADLIVGGDGTDIIGITDTASIADADLTGVLTVETLKLSAGTGAQTVTLDAQALEAGIVTVDGSVSAQDVTVTVTAGYTGNLTVLANSADNSITGGAGNDTIVSNSATQLDTTATGNDSIAGGAGTDKIRLDNDSSTDGTGNAVTMTVGAGLVSGVEQIVINDTATDSGAAGDATVSFVAGYAQTSGLTIDGSALDAGEVLTVDTSANGASETVSITGGAADDVFTLSSIADSVNGGAGNDTFSFADANIASGDLIVGGDGTDIITITDAASIADADLTGVLTVETLKLSAGAGAQTVTLDAQALEAGIVTVDGSASAQDVTVTVTAGYTGNLTILANSADNSITGGAGNDTIVSNSAMQLDTTATGNDSIAGGAGTDKIRLDNDSGTDGTGNAVTMTVGAGLVSGVEQIVINDTATDAGAAGDATVSFVAGYAQTSGLTIDGSALDTGEVLTVDTSANAASETVTILGGAADDVFTLSSIADSVDGGAGNDTFNIAVASLASSDIITGGTGSLDVIALTGMADVADTLFTNVTGIEKLTLASVSSSTPVSLVLGAQALEAGITTVVASGVGDTTMTINAGGYSATAVNISLAAGATTADDTVFNIFGGAGNDTIDLSASSGTGADFIQGGAGADTITLSGTGASASSTDTVRVNLGSELASGTTVTAADTVNAFQDGADLLEFVGGTLASGGGGQVVLSTGLDDLNTASDVYEATSLAQLQAFNSGSVGSAYVILLDNVAAFDSNGGNGFTGGASAATAQGAVSAAVTYLTGNSVAATAVANTNVIIGVTVDTNNNAAADGVALFQYQEGTLDAGIQASELTLIGIYNGVAVDNLTIADFK